LKITAISPGVRYILVATFFFALMNIGVKFLDRIPAYEIVFFRAFITLIVVYLLIRRAGLQISGNNKPLLLLRGLTGTGALMMYFYTLQNMPLASAVTIQYLSPIFTIIIAGFMLRESTRRIQWLLFLLSFSGVLLVKGFDTRVSPTDLVIGISAAVCSGFAYNFIRKLKNTDHPLVVVFYFPVVTVPIVGCYLLFNWVSPSPQEWIILLLIGLATTVAQIYMTKAYQLERAANISNYNYLGVVYALIFGFSIFGETLSLLAVCGILLIIAGVAGSSRFTIAKKETDEIRN